MATTEEIKYTIFESQVVGCRGTERLVLESFDEPGKDFKKYSSISTREEPIEH